MHSPRLTTPACSWRRVTTPLHTRHCFRCSCCHTLCWTCLGAGKIRAGNRNRISTCLRTHVVESLGHANATRDDNELLTGISLFTYFACRRTSRHWWAWPRGCSAVSPSPRRTWRQPRQQSPMRPCPHQKVSAQDAQHSVASQSLRSLGHLSACNNCRPASFLQFRHGGKILPQAGTCASTVPISHLTTLHSWSAGAGDWPSGASLHPSMYSALPEDSASQSPWNLRAGWITGRRVTSAL